MIRGYQIEREIWKKAIINAVFNAICPLLEIDNGVFARDEAGTMPGAVPGPRLRDLIGAGYPLTRQFVTASSLI